MPRQTAMTAKPLSLAERKALVAKLAKDAPAKVRAGLAMIDFRELTPGEKEIGERLARERRGRRVA
ncbi:MAG TPA: hypothetical protein VGM54_21195 [Chthoniobacter sp.]